MRGWIGRHLRIDRTSDRLHAGPMIRLTLTDGTRLQLTAAEVTEIEPIAGGSLVHRATGKPLHVVQDARTVELRLRAALAAAERTEEEAPSDPQGPAEVPTRPDRGSLSDRAKRLLRGRVSLPTMILSRRR